MEKFFEDNFNIKNNIELDNFDLFEKINYEENSNSCKKEWLTPLKVNSKLEVHIGTENKIIYVAPRRAQYFLVHSSKGCGANIKYIGENYDKCKNRICGFLGYYFILNAGILFIPKKYLKPGTIDILTLKAEDGCNYYKFDAVFSYCLF